MQVRTADQVTLARRAVQDWATQMGFGTVERTKFVTAASELARNTLVHGKGGTMRLGELRSDDGRAGLELVFEDQGPGIADIDKALTDGYSTGNSLGLGLGGSRRLSNEFDIRSAPGEGTWVRVVLWKRR